MISQNIRSLREHEGFTQEALASRLGVARQTVAKWESGEATPDLENVRALARLFGVSIDDLVIPKRAREVFDLVPGSELLVLGDESQGLALQKVEDALAMMESFGRAINERH